MPPRPVRKPPKPTPGLFDDMPEEDESPSEGDSRPVLTSLPTPDVEPKAGRPRDLFDSVDYTPPSELPQLVETTAPPRFFLNAEPSSGEKAKARDIIVALRIVNTVEREARRATADEQAALAKFPGFRAVALSLFPDPLRGTYKDGEWRKLGEELGRLLSPAEYASARRTTFNAFYTSPTVIAAITRLGVPATALVLEPGCGSGNFLARAPAAMRFVGVEQDAVSARVARFPDQVVRHEDFTASRLG